MEFRVPGAIWKGSAGEDDEAGYQGVGEGVVEDGAADEARRACEDEFHFFFFLEVDGGSVLGV